MSESATAEERAAIGTSALGLVDVCRGIFTGASSGTGTVTRLSQTPGSDNAIAIVIALTSIPCRKVVTACLGVLAPVQQELRVAQVGHGPSPSLLSHHDTQRHACDLHGNREGAVAGFVSVAASQWAEMVHARLPGARSRLIERPGSFASVDAWMDGWHECVQLCASESV